MAKIKGTRYSVTLAPELENEFTEVAERLGITKSEALRRALTLYKHAVDADRVELHGADGKSREVLLK